MGETKHVSSSRLAANAKSNASLEKTLARLGWANCILSQSEAELVTVLDRSFTICQVSKATEKIFGKEAIGRKCYQIYHDLETNCPACPAKKLLTSGQRDCTFEDSAKGRTYAIHAYPFTDEQGSVVAIVEHAVDITSTKEAERRLVETNAFWRTVYDSVAEAISIINVADFTIAEVNRAFLEKYGMTREQVIGKTCHEVTHHLTAPCSGPDHSCPLVTSVATGNYSVFEHIHKDKDGRDLIFEVSAVPIHNEDGRITRGVHITRDITDRKKAETELISSEMRYRALFRQAGDCIFLLEPHENSAPLIVDVNNAALELHGYTREEMIGRPVSFLEVSYTPAGNEERVRNLETAGRVKFEVVHRKKNGDLINLAVESSVLDIGDHKLILATEHNVTDTRRLDEERLRSAKLESLGLLAGGIAHDFNNVLAGVLTNIQLANIYIDRGACKEASEVLSEAESAAFRARDLTQQLLTFSKGGVPIKKTVNIGKLVKSSTKFILSGAKTMAEFNIDNGLFAISADEGQLTQVINNIVVNADQAMPVGGTINVAAANLKEDERLSLGLPENNYVKISIQDHGMGIPKSSQAKLFDPYFTTKQKGSGLGLATAYSIIKNHNGLLTFQSEIGKGTTFFIYLPAMKNKVRKTLKKARGTAAPPPVARGRVLITDDEKILRDAIQRVLLAVGYEVETVSSGESAVARYEEALNAGKPFDAVILDLTMPGGMGGKETMARLREIDPQVKAIVSSGYANDPIMSDYAGYGFSAVVTKPYGIQEMCRKLEEVIGRP